MEQEIWKPVFVKKNQPLLLQIACVPDHLKKIELDKLQIELMNIYA